MLQIISRPIKLIPLFLAGFLTISVNVHALDFTLNGKKHHVINPTHFSVGSSGLQIKSFYPWMERVEILEIHSRTENTRFTPENGLARIWSEGLLEFEDGNWLIRAGNLKFTSPKKISLWGKVTKVDRITVWSGLNDETYRDAMKAQMILHGVELDWLEVNNLHLALETITGTGEQPDIILYDSVQMSVLEPLIGENRVIGGRPLKHSPYLRKTTFFNPETLIPYLTQDKQTEDSVQFNFNLQNLVKLIKAGREMILDNGLTREIELGAETSSSQITPDENLIEKTEKIILEYHAAIPNLTDKSPRTPEELTGHILNDAETLWQFNNSILPPDKRKKPIRDNRTGRFFAAWNRLGRLAISGQISPEIAATLIMNYMEDSSS